MRSIGFSTGALALADFRHALFLLEHSSADAVELSALRGCELQPLVSALSGLELRRFKHISFHAPSRIEPACERNYTELLKGVAGRGWLVIVHPDTITDHALWRGFGRNLCLENMDKRKPVGQTADQLSVLFDRFPEATFCFDLGHARQVDPTMTEAFMIIRKFRSRFAQLHVSEVSSESRHAPLTVEAIMAFEKVARLLPGNIPVIIESRVTASEIEPEIRLVKGIMNGLTQSVWEHRQAEVLPA